MFIFDARYGTFLRIAPGTVAENHPPGSPPANILYGEWAGWPAAIDDIPEPLHNPDTQRPGTPLPNGTWPVVALSFAEIDAAAEAAEAETERQEARDLRGDLKTVMNNCAAIDDSALSDNAARNAAIKSLARDLRKAAKGERFLLDQAFQRDPTLRFPASSFSEVSERLGWPLLVAGVITDWQAGDWLEFMFDLVAPWTDASLALLVSNPAAGGTIDIAVDGVAVGTITVQPTASFESMDRRKKTIGGTLTAGTHTLRLTGAAAATNGKVANLALISIKP